MASKLFTRFLPPTTGEPSIYETIRQHDDLDHSDVEERAGMTVEGEVHREHYRDPEQRSTDADPEPEAVTSRKVQGPVSHVLQSLRSSQNRRRTQQAKEDEMEELDDEVPQSLLIEDDQDPTLDAAKHQRMQIPLDSSSTNPGVRAKWHAAQQQQRLYHNTIPPQTPSKPRGSSRWRAAEVDPKEKALWMWANVENLDNFLAEVYEYYIGNGIWSITLTRMLNLMSVILPTLSRELI